MTFVPPNSSAMDATAGSGGPITMLPQIITGQPESIFTHVEQVLAKAAKFGQLLEQFSDAEKQLQQVWSGQTQEAASKKITDTLQQFEKIVKVLEEGAQLLGVSGTMVQTAQTGYQTVVSAVNPTVAGLMSNPWTYSAAVALSTGTSASLRGFIEAIGAALKALGVGQLATKITELATVIGDLEKLFGSTGQDNGSTSGQTNASLAASPVTAPTAPQSVASAAGMTAATGANTDAAAEQAAIANATAAQAAAQTSAPTGLGTGTGSFTDYTPTALGGSATSGYDAGSYGTNGYGSVLGSGSSYGTDAAQSAFVPVDSGSQSLAAQYPNGVIPDSAVLPTAADVPTTDPTTATVPGHDTGSYDTGSTGTGSQDVRVTTTDGNVTTTVEVPAGHDTNVDLNLTVDGQQITEHAHIGADGSVTTS